MTSAFMQADSMPVLLHWRLLIQSESVSPRPQVRMKLSSSFNDATSPLAYIRTQIATALFTPDRKMMDHRFSCQHEQATFFRRSILHSV